MLMHNANKKRFKTGDAFSLILSIMPDGALALTVPTAKVVISVEIIIFWRLKTVV